MQMTLGWRPYYIVILLYFHCSVCKVFRNKRNKIKRYGEKLLLRIVTIIIFWNLNSTLKFIMVWKFFKRVKCTFVLFYIRRIQFIILFNNKLLIQYIYYTITCTCNLCTSRLHLRITKRPPPGEYPAGNGRFFLILDLRSSVYPYFHQQLRLLHVQKSIRFCNFYYCEIADAGGWYTDKRSSEQNGYASRLFWSSRNVKNMSERNARKRIKWLNFRRKFIPCRELFLTKTASK